MENSSNAQGPDDDVPTPGQHFAQFGAGCLWGVELLFHRMPCVTRTEAPTTTSLPWVSSSPSLLRVAYGASNYRSIECLMSAGSRSAIPKTLHEHTQQLRFRVKPSLDLSSMENSSIAQGPNDDVPTLGQ
ncbi:hypothetical protein ACOSP7_018195 [Xanthoceras sorbifolium]